MTQQKPKNDDKQQQNIIWFVLGVTLGVTINWGVGLAFIAIYVAKELNDKQQPEAKKVPVKIKRDDY